MEKDQIHIRLSLNYLITRQEEETIRGVDIYKPAADLKSTAHRWSAFKPIQEIVARRPPLLP